MRKIRFALLLLLAALLCCISVSAVIPDRVANATTKEGYNYMMRLIGKQSFSAELPKETVKNYIEHYTYHSDFAAYYQKTFPSKNTIGYFNAAGEWVTLEWHPTYYSLSDGTYSHEGTGAQGCCLYSRHLTLVIYGTEGGRVYLKQNTGETRGDAFKRLLLTYGQAGEHIRIDSTHSATYVSGDENGFYYFNYENNGWPVITMCYESYSAFADRYSGKSIWLYDSNTLTNDLNAQPDPEYFIPDDVAHVTPAPVCKHEKYSSAGYCKGCGQEFPLNVESLTSTEYTVINSAPIRPRPYAVVKQVTRFNARDKVTVVGKAYNSYGKLWYRVKSDKLGLNTFWVYSENVARINDVSIELTDITDIGESSLTVNGVCSYTLRRPDRVVLLLGTSKDKMSKIGSDVINHNMNPFKIWYKLTGIKKDTLYYYQMIVEYDNLEYSALIDKSTFKTKIGTFMISSEKTNETVEKPDSEVVDNTMAGLLDAIVPVKLDVKSVTSLAQTSARFNASCTYIETRPSYVCLYLGLSADTNSMWQVGYDKITHSKNPFDIWYDVSGMAENTTYYYQFRAEADGKIYTSDVHTVTTMNKAPIDNAMDAALGALGALGNTRTGVISGTSLLAINDKAAASPTNSTMIGTAPEGAYVTVYPDKQSGSWYYITYNGVSGYAYGKYITLK